MILIEEAEYSASLADVWILSRCVQHESHPMNHDFKVEFNYSWLAPPVDDYLKVQKQKKKLKRCEISFSIVFRRNGTPSSRLPWRGKACPKLRVSGENQNILKFDTKC